MKQEFLIALLSLSLSGCSDYPGHQSRNGVRMTTKPVWGESLNQEILLGGDCHIDSINDEPGEGPLIHKVKQKGPAMKISGWSAISVHEGTIATDIAIALKNRSAQDTRLFAIVSKENRPDVAEYFKNQGSVESGFKATIDLSDVSPGNYILEVIQHKNGKSFKCPLSANVIVEN